MKWADLKDLFEKASKNVCGISWHLVSQSINVFSSKAPEHTEYDPDDSALVDERWRRYPSGTLLSLVVQS